MADSDRTLYEINHLPEQMTAGDVVEPANMLSFGQYETPEQAVRDIIRWFIDRDMAKVKPCEHGNYAPHEYSYTYRASDGGMSMAIGQKCDGKPEADGEV